MELKRWANWTHPYFNTIKGQALLELAIFGSILIMLLGVLINYGLKYNSQQQVMQQAFRKVLGLAADRGSASYTLFKEQNIPDPSNPFAVGSVIPVTSSASVTRDYSMDMVPTEAEELSSLVIEMPDSQVRSYKTGAFRDENVLEGDLDKYTDIYGSEGIAWWKIGDGECGCEQECIINPQTGAEICTCPCPTKNIRIIDDCAGEIMNYEKMNLRCAKVKAAGINEPWYCSKLDTLFAFSDVGEPNMGLQPDYIQNTTRDNALTRQENSSSVNTKDTLKWQIATQRTIVFNDSLDDEGVSKGEANLKTVDVTSTAGQDKTYKWRTGW